MNINTIKLIASDLDGTLLNSEQVIENTDLKTLIILGNKNIIRVFATGRSLFSAQKVLKKKTPFDYLIFSSGAGVLNWQNQELIYKSFIENKMVTQIADYFKQKKFSFMLHHEIPNNHCFFYSKRCRNTDFENRIRIYYEHAIPYDNNSIHASQFLVIFDKSEHYLFEKTKQEINTLFPNINIIRATSPLNGESIWMELFPKSISKQKTLEWLCNKLNINQINTFGIGNDYNDIDFLEWVEYAYMVDNSPNELKSKFLQTSCHNTNGFSEAIKNHFRL